MCFDALPYAFSEHTEQEDDELCRKDAEEHAEGIDGAVAYGRRIVVGRLVGKREGRRVGGAAGYHFADSDEKMIFIKVANVAAQSAGYDKMF